MAFNVRLSLYGASLGGDRGPDLFVTLRIVESAFTAFTAMASNVRLGRAKRGDPVLAVFLPLRFTTSGTSSAQVLPALRGK